MSSSTRVDEKLIKTGLRIIAKQGLRALTVRQLCRTADVNLGLFIYYFKNKEQYLKSLFERVSMRIGTILNSDEIQEKSALDRVYFYYERCLALFVENRNLIKAILYDIVNDDIFYETCVKKGIIKPLNMGTTLIKDAQEKNLIKKDMSATEINREILFSYLLPSLSIGNKAFIALGLQDKSLNKQYYINKVHQFLISLEENK